MSDELPVKMGFEQAGSRAQVGVGDDLWEMHAAGAKIVEFTAGRSEEAFAGNEALRAAVRSMLALMGEALGRLGKAAPELATKLDGPDLLELCVKLDAGEGGDAEVWNFVQRALPELHGRAAEELAAWHEG